MSRYRAILAYDGTDFVGFQRQIAGRTVQAELEGALQRLARVEVPVRGAGRTDSGVHAAGQVVAFDLDWAHGLDELRRALNARLPSDVSVLDVSPRADDFDPRRAARSRRYRYTIYHAPQRHPLFDRHAWQVWPPLSVERMAAAAEKVVGRHDFAAFGTPPTGRGHTRRTVRRSEWTVEPDRDFSVEWLHYHIEADAFLYRMVRTLVGTLKGVGQGGMSVEDFAAVLEAGERARSGPAAPARGLCLMEVTYG